MLPSGALVLLLLSLLLQRPRPPRLTKLQQWLLPVNQN